MAPAAKAERLLLEVPLITGKLEAGLTFGREAEDWTCRVSLIASRIGVENGKSSFCVDISKGNEANLTEAKVPIHKFQLSAFYIFRKLINYVHSNIIDNMGQQVSERNERALIRPISVQTYEFQKTRKTVFSGSRLRWKRIKVISLVSTALYQIKLYICIKCNLM